MYNDREYHRKLMKKRRKSAKTAKRIHESNSAWKRKKYVVLNLVKSAFGCLDCRETDPVVLDFDHRDRSTKKHSISDMVIRGSSWKTIVEEMVKCDIRCANCHRRMTVKRRQEFKNETSH